MIGRRLRSKIFRVERAGPASDIEPVFSPRNVNPAQKIVGDEPAPAADVLS